LKSVTRAHKKQQKERENKIKKKSVLQLYTYLLATSPLATLARVSLVSSLIFLFVDLFPEVDFLLAEVTVRRLVVVGGILAGDRVVGEVAHQSNLVEDGAETADEGPHSGPEELFGVQVRVADVEDPAPVGHVGVVSVLQPITA